MNADLSELSVAELERVINQARSLVETKQSDAIKDAYNQIEAIAAGVGMSLDALIQAGRARTRKAPALRRPVEARYRNPDNPADTWTGRGKPPRWLAAKINAGANKEDFLI